MQQNNFFMLMDSIQSEIMYMHGYLETIGEEKRKSSVEKAFKAIQTLMKSFYKVDGQDYNPIDHKGFQAFWDTRNRIIMKPEDAEAYIVQSQHEMDRLTEILSTIRNVHSNNGNSMKIDGNNRINVSKLMKEISAIYGKKEAVTA